MIVSEKDAIARLESPMNLMNRMRSSKNRSMSLFDGSGQISNSPRPQTSFINPFDKSNKTAVLVPSATAQRAASAADEIPQPNLDNLLDNADSRIKLSIAHDKALDTLVSAVGLLKDKLDDIKPDKLPAAIAATSKVVDSIQRQRIDANKSKTGREVHYHFYTPTQKKIEEYTVIDVGG